MIGPREPALPDDDGAPAQESFTFEDRRASVTALGASGWLPNEQTYIFSGVSWCPDLSTADERLLHLHLLPELGRAWKRRIEAALNSGRSVTVAAPLLGWYSAETLGVLAPAGVGAIVLVPGTPWTVRLYASVARLIAREGILLPTELLQTTATALLDDALAESDNYRKGRKFEDVLGLMLSQVSYFDVLEFNIKNPTEEIDILLKNRRIPERALPSAPLVLVSAKNEKDPIGKDALVALVGQMDNKRGQCQLGFLCSARKIARTVDTEDIGYRRDDRVVAMIDGQCLRDLISDPVNLDDRIEQLIIEAAIR